ncbi:hypothetical protein B566_EDAN003888 [Ephemera danica]|nr:hypothetical protein B566_EDAN003888 [Ephemera danica]
MEQVVQNQLLEVVKQVEEHVDEQLQKLEKLDIDDLEKLREKRLDEMKAAAKKKQEWLSMGHGEYSELTDEKEFFEVSKKSSSIVCHFYKDGTPRCKIVDHHLAILAPKHPEARFCKVNVERCPFLTQRLSIRVIPTIALIVNQKTKDYIVGFTDLGNRDDFKTDILEWRIAQAGGIQYAGDLATPPDQEKKSSLLLQKSIRGTQYSDSDSDLED